MPAFGGQDLGLTAWACSRLVFVDPQLLAALSAQAIPKIAHCEPRNLANLAWAWASMVLPDKPLLAAIAAASLRNMRDFNAQNLANTAWSCARLAVSDGPLLDAIAAEALRKIDAFVATDSPQEGYAVLWGLWRAGGQQAAVGGALAERLADGLLADGLVLGLLLSVAEWRASALDEMRLRLALGRGLPASTLRELLLCSAAPALPPAPLAFQAMYHMYRRLSRCVDHVVAGTQPPSPRSPSRVLGLIEGFGQGVGQWLKVAGGEKAALTEGALKQRGRLSGYELSAEFGAFVGYSGIRFACCLLETPQRACRTAEGSQPIEGRSRRAAPGGVSLEVDPVHAAVARHFVDLAGLSLAAEVWLGLLQDTVALLPERSGEASGAFSFMDQRGTTFHEDLALLERMRLLPPRAAVTADNVSKPGAPVFLWHLTRCPQFAASSALWSLREFASEEVEDWQAAAVAGPPAAYGTCSRSSRAG
mmetsp:Transcript_24135/g.75041  ORF Transcript_24135/g.75041 Transcript_24135/m.75041 type:complete len:477 (+) Transcript_24135:117-1547(+)